MPSPTVLVANQIRLATARGQDLLLTGTIMGGGPNDWAAHDHLRAGHRVFATPEAALTFNDDLDQVEKSGIEIVSPDKTSNLSHAARVNLRDFDLDAIRRAFAAFGVPLEFDALAVAVFDHGNAPPDVSDRLFRFEFLAERIRAVGKLSAFAFMREEVPDRLTRMKAVADSIDTDKPVLIMDTAPAAILGALEDDRVREHPTRLVVNVGNFHTLAFRFREGAITGCFEHHSGELSDEQLEGFIAQLADSTLTHDAIFNSQGHGALLFDDQPVPLDFVAVLGPKRGKLLRSRLQPYFAVPYGDMMLAGDYGLVRAYADLNPRTADEIERAFAGARALV
jgi:uncharacterized protein (DUF1786 family)